MQLLLVTSTNPPRNVTNIHTERTEKVKPDLQEMTNFSCH